MSQVSHVTCGECLRSNALCAVCQHGRCARHRVARVELKTSAWMENHPIPMRLSPQGGWAPATGGLAQGMHPNWIQMWGVQCRFEDALTSVVPTPAATAARVQAWVNEWWTSGACMRCRRSLAERTLHSSG